jgi:hypothetical protein
VGSGVGRGCSQRQTALKRDPPSAALTAPLPRWPPFNRSPLAEFQPPVAASPRLKRVYRWTQARRLGPKSRPHAVLALHRRLTQTAGGETSRQSVRLRGDGLSPNPQRPAKQSRPGPWHLPSAQRRAVVSEVAAHVTSRHPLERNVVHYRGTGHPPSFVPKAQQLADDLGFCPIKTPAWLAPQLRIVADGPLLRRPHDKVRAEWRLPSPFEA